MNQMYFSMTSSIFKTQQNKQVFSKTLLRLCQSMFILFISGWIHHSQAQSVDWPKKPIQLILSFPAGGATDIMGRAVAASLEPILGQAVVIENKPGAGGMIGLLAAAKANPDGYTFHISAMTNQAISQSIFPNPPADLRKDFVPVALLGGLPHLIEINPKIPANNLKELIAYIKAQNGNFNFASQGNGSLSHLEAELFLQKIGAKANHIPYKGSSFALPDLIAGNTQMMFDSIGASIGQIKTSKLRPIAIAASVRSPLLPDIPTLAQAGMPEFNVENLCALYAPKGVPPVIIEKMQNALKQVLNNPENRNRIENQGLYFQFENAVKLAELTTMEHDKWSKVVKSIQLKID